MVRNIVVPLDGSALAERALPPAEALARAAGARLLLVRVVTDDGGSVAGGSDAREYLDGIARASHERGVEATTAVLSGEAAAAIVDEARRQGADLIAMATHGRGGLGRWVYGSVAEAVLARATAPTLLVRAWQAGHGPAPLRPGGRLLVPLDGSDFAEEALPVATGLADTLGGEIVLLRAVARSDLPFGPDAILAPLLQRELDEERAQAEDYLRRVAERFAREGRAVRTEVRVGRPDLEMAAGVIESVGREYSAALVVMASHRYTGMNRLLLGSVADGVVRHGTLPLLLVRPQGQGGTRPGTPER